MRHVYQALCLVVLLIAGQQGAVVHELGHLSEAHGGICAVSGQAADANCALCPAFAQVVTAALTHSFVAPLALRVGGERVLEPRAEQAAGSIPTPRNRGPPSLS